MLQAATFTFLKNLKKNNNKAWMDANRAAYLAAKEDFEQLVKQVLAGLAKVDNGYAHLQPKDCTFRINRDVRFSKDKSPYKTNLAASFNKQGKKTSGASFYFQVEPGNSFCGGGVYMPEAPHLASLRQEIDYSFAEWKKIVQAPAFKKAFPAGVDGVETLSRPPKGYTDDNPAIEYLKMKSFIAMRPLTDKDLLSKPLAASLVKTFTIVHPFIGFLNRAIGE